MKLCVPQVLTAINGSEMLCKKLFQVNFLSTLADEAVVTMIYHKPLDSEWSSEATELKNKYTHC